MKCQSCCTQTDSDESKMTTNYHQRVCRDDGCNEHGNWTEAQQFKCKEHRKSCKTYYCDAGPVEDGWCGVCKNHKRVNGSRCLELGCEERSRKRDGWWCPEHKKEHLCKGKYKTGLNCKSLEEKGYEGYCKHHYFVEQKKLFPDEYCARGECRNERWETENWRYSRCEDHVKMYKKSRENAKKNGPKKQKPVTTLAKERVNSYVSKRQTTINQLKKKNKTRKVKLTEEQILERTKKYKFELDKNEAIKLVQKKCHYCGAYNPDDVVGIDRKNSSFHYVEGNVVACCEQCNKAKNEWSFESFVSMCVKVADNHGQAISNAEESKEDEQKE